MVTAFSTVEDGRNQLIPGCSLLNIASQVWQQELMVLEQPQILLILARYTLVHSLARSLAVLEF
jgi:hypothetical protein